MTGVIALVVLDLAGTTIDVGDGVADSFRGSLAAFGIALSPAQIAAVRGASKRQAIAELVEAHQPSRVGEVEIIYREFCKRLEAASREFTPYPRAEQAIGVLRDHGVRVVLNTGFDRATTRRILSAVGWDGVADAVVAGDEVARGRPAPDLILRAMTLTGVTDTHLVANVGDTTLDLQAGAKAGVRLNVGVWSGAHGRDRLDAAPHTHLLATVAEVPELIIGRA